MFTDASKSLIKGLKLIDLFQSHPRLTLQEMSQLSGIPKTTVHRLVNSLVEAELLSPSSNEGYMLGLKLLHLGGIVKDRLDLRQIALPIMQMLEHEVHEAVNLIISRNLEAVFIETVQTEQPLRVYSQVGRAIPLYAGAIPRTILAFMGVVERARVFTDAPLMKLACGTITDCHVLEETCTKVRRDGFAVSYSETTEGFAAVGAPIHDDIGNVIAALGIAGPEHRFQAVRLPSLIEATVGAADAVSKSLGYLKPTP